MIRIFDVSQPGRSFEARPTCKTRKSKTGQRGIISALAFCPERSGGGLFAAGSYAKTICLYSENRQAYVWCYRIVFESCCQWFYLTGGDAIYQGDVMGMRSMVSPPACLPARAANE